MIPKPCQTCLVLPACRNKENIRCDVVFMWLIDVDADTACESVNEMFGTYKVVFSLSDKNVIDDELREKIKISQNGVVKWREKKGLIESFARPKKFMGGFKE